MCNSHLITHQLQIVYICYKLLLGHAVVLGCPRGPCWLWGTCQHRGYNAALKQSARSGPLLAIIGSARPTEHERQILFQMCDKRPLLCSVFNTGSRENSTSFVHSRIADMYQLLMASTFCLIRQETRQPERDYSTRWCLAASQL